MAAAVIDVDPAKVWVKFCNNRKFGDVREVKVPEVEYPGDMTILALSRDLVNKQGVVAAPAGGGTARQHLHIFVTIDPTTGEAFVPTPDQTLANLASLYAHEDKTGRHVLGIIYTMKVYMG